MNQQDLRLILRALYPNCYFLILIQMNITNDTTSPFSDIYDRIYQIIKSKGSFNFKQFSDYIYGILFKFYLNLFY